MTVRRPTIFRCYRCGELRNGKPKMIINEKPLCALCVEQPHHIYQEARTG